MNTTVDGEFQKYAVESRRVHPRALLRSRPAPRSSMVEHLTDDDLQQLPRGGHDYRKLYAAYKMAVEHEGSPTVILAKTVKGWTLGAGARGAQRDAPDQEARRRRSSRRSATGCSCRSPTPSSRTATRRTATRAPTRPSTST